MSWDKARDGIKMAEIAVHALEVIQGLTRIGGATGVSAIGAIQVVLQTVNDGFEGKTTPELVLAELETLRAQIASNDASADAALHDKFESETKIDIKSPR